MPPKFLNSVWCMLIIALAISVISYFLMYRLWGGNEPVIISVCISVIFFLLSNKLIHDREEKKSKREENDKLLAEIEKRATVEYVDTQDDHILDRFDQHLKESKESDRDRMELIKSMDGKLTRLYDKLIKL